MSALLLRALGEHLRADAAGIYASVGGYVYTIDTANRASWPLLYIFETDSRRIRGWAGKRPSGSTIRRSRTDQSIVRFGLLVDSRNAEYENTGIVIGRQIEDYLEENWKFTTADVAPYASCKVWKINDGRQTIETFEQVQMYMLDPTYRMVGTWIDYYQVGANPDNAHVTVTP